MPRLMNVCPRRSVSLCGTVLALALISVGCFDSQPAPDEQKIEPPFAGLEIHVAVPQELGLTNAWNILLDEWSAQTGAACRIIEYGATPSAESLQAVASGDAGAGSSADLLIMPITSLATLNHAGLLQPIPEEQRAQSGLHWLDLFQGLRDNVASPNRTPTVIPIASPTLVCYYRKDLLDAAGLAPPETWDDYRNLLATLDEWAPGLTAVEPWGEEYRATMFLARALPLAKHPGHFSLFFDIDRGEPLIDNPAFVRALEEAQADWSQMPPEIVGFTPADCRRELTAGRAALAVAFETGPGNPPLPFGPGSPAVEKPGDVAEPESAVRSTAMRIGFCQLPGVPRVYNRSTDAWEPPSAGGLNQPTLTAFGGLCAGVSSNASEAEAQAAWNLLATLAIDYLPTAFPDGLKTLCRESQISLATAWLGEDLAADERYQYTLTVARSLREPGVVAELPVVGREQFRAALTAGLGDVLAGTATPDAALTATASAWRELADEIGRDMVRDSYRQSLGLSPLSPSK